MTDLESCIERLSSPDESERIYAAEDIGYTNDAGAAAALLARLAEEPSRAVLEAIFRALFEIEDDAVIDGMMALLDSEDSFLRNQAVGLLRARCPKSLQALEQAFSEGNADRRKFVIDVVAMLGDAGTSEIYARALKDPDLNVVITAVENLGHGRKSDLRGPVEALVTRNAHPMLLCACLETLAQIGEASSIETLRAALSAGSDLPGYLLPSYLKLLGAKGQPAEVAEIVARIANPGLAAHAVNALTSMLNRYPGLPLPRTLIAPLRSIVERNESPLLAYQALRLLGPFLADDGAFQFTEQCLRHPDKAVRIGAVQALREAGGERAGQAIASVLANETDEEILQAAGKSGD